MRRDGDRERGGNPLLLVGFVFFRGLVGRVGAAAGAASAVAGGDLMHKPDSRVSDESGVLLRAIGTMVQSLEALVLDLKGSSVDLISTANGVAAAAT